MEFFEDFAGVLRFPCAVPYACQGFGREWAEDDLSLCSSSCASKLAGSGLTADDTMSYLSAKTALSLAESYEELATLLATYHLDNSHRLVSVASTASLASLMPSCSSSSRCA